MALAGLGLFIPVPGITITPLICLIVGLHTPDGMSAAGHIAAFDMGTAWAFPVLQHPAAAAPSRNEACPFRRPVRQVILGHLLNPGAQRNYVTQVAIVIPVLNITLALCHWPYAGWVLIGVLTILRLSWSATRSRVVKRSIGMVGGSIVAAISL